MELDGFLHHPFKRLEMTGGRPEFQLGIACALKMNHQLPGAVMNFESRNRLSVTAIEAFGNPKD